MLAQLALGIRQWAGSDEETTDVVVTHMTGSVFTAGLVLQKRYRLDDPVAVGGMAEVWRGHDLVLQRAVAIKLLHPHLAADSTVAERFRREAISAARLSHPHIVPTYDAGTEDGVSFIILGLIDGPTLAQVLRTKQLSEHEATTIARQVADALDHAHRSGLIHRDIKPSNILLVDNEQRVMVADFGIAKAIDATADPSLTLPGFVIGTPDYVAPEQAHGANPDARSDVYAAGVLLHEMLCGHTSHDQPTQLSQADSTQSASETCPTVPPSLEHIVALSTAPNPTERYQDAAELRSALEQAERSIAKKQPHRRVIPQPPEDFSNKTQAVPVQSDEPKVDLTDREPERPSPIYIADNPTPVPTSPKEIRTRGEKYSRHRRKLALLVVFILVVGAASIGRIVANAGNHASHTPTTLAAQPLALSAANSFDPAGDKTENEAQISAVFDNNPATSWSTETYTNRKFGNLKPGVGVILQVSNPQQLASLTVDSNTQNWSGSIYIAPSTGPTPTTLAGWGNPIDTQTNVSGSATFNLHQTKASAILFWITDLGDSNKFTTSEIHLNQAH